MKKSDDLLDIIQNERVYPVFQPILSLKDGEILGYEALSRIKNIRRIQNSEELFELGVFFHKTWDLEKMCRKKILRRYAELEKGDGKEKLFINVNPLVMLDDHFKSNFTKKQLQKIGISPDKIVIEITERNTYNNVVDFQQTVQHYKEEGYQLAIDDVGSCYSGLNVVCHTNPHYLKVDRELIKEIDKDLMKQALVRGLVEVAQNSSIELIAEGIETAKEFDMVVKLGVNYGQGYYIAKPSEELEDPSEASLKRIHKKEDKKSLLDETEEYRALYVTMKNYKDLEAYAMKYGDEKADKLFGTIKKILLSCLMDGEEVYAVDDITYLVVVQKARLDLVESEIDRLFKATWPDYYDAKDLENGYIEYLSHKGNVKQRNLISLKIDEVVKD